MCNESPEGSLISLYIVAENTRSQESCGASITSVIGAFDTLFVEMRNDGAEFFNCFGMSMSNFDELLQRLRNSLKCENTKMRNCISFAELLAVSIYNFVHIFIALCYLLVCLLLRVLEQSKLYAVSVFSSYFIMLRTIILIKQKLFMSTITTYQLSIIYFIILHSRKCIS